MNITGHIEGFKAYLESSTELGETTKGRYPYEVGLFARSVGDQPVENLTPRMLLDWNIMLHQAGAAHGTVGQKHAAVKKFLEYLSKFESSETAKVLLDALREIKIPRNGQAVREAYALDEDQVGKILEAAGTRPGVGVRDRALVHFIWATGVRRAEACDALLPGLDLEARTASVVGKGDKARVVLFDDPCRQDLTTWLDLRPSWSPQVDNVFISALGGPLGKNSLSKLVREAAGRAGLRKGVWTHVFRHSRITALLNRGMSLQEAAVLAGHANIQTTMHYYHEDLGQLRESYDRATGPRRRRRRGDGTETGESDGDPGGPGSELSGRD